MAPYGDPNNGEYFNGADFGTPNKGLNGLKFSNQNFKSINNYKSNQIPKKANNEVENLKQELEDMKEMVEELKEQNSNLEKNLKINKDLVLSLANK